MHAGSMDLETLVVAYLAALDAFDTFRPPTGDWPRDDPRRAEFRALGCALVEAEHRLRDAVGVPVVIEVEASRSSNVLRPEEVD